jgi:hypothetical protein
MADLTVKNDDPPRLQHRDVAALPPNPPPPAMPQPAAKTLSATRDTAERWQPRAGACAPRTDTRAARSPEVLVSAMRRSARSVMVDPAPKAHDAKHGAETVGAHGLMESAAHVLEAIGKHAAGKGLSVAAPVITFAEYGVHALEQSRAGAIGSQRKAAALGFSRTLAAALNRGTRCFEEARKDQGGLPREVMSMNQQEREFFTWGASAAARFSTTLTPAERRSLMVELGKRPSGEKVAQDVTFDLALRIQSHVLGAERWRL